MEEISLKVNNLMNFSQAAEYLGITRQSIHNYVRRGKLHPISIGKSRFLLVEELDRLKELERPKYGNS